MPRMTDLLSIEESRVAFDPSRYGLQRDGLGWRIQIDTIGAVRFAELGWAHAQVESAAPGDPHVDGLAFLAQLQGTVWGMPPQDWVPSNFLAVLADTGGSVIAAYREDLGWTPDGWLGFAISAGGRDGVLVSHMVGVREDVRGSGGIGWLLKVVQGYLALGTGHHAAVWTFDPMRAANARLNLEKLGATARLLTIDKYGPLRSELYGDVPSDRLTAHWALTDPRVHARLAAVAADSYRSPLQPDVTPFPLATTGNVGALRGEDLIRYAIPGDIDRLAGEDPGAATDWRREMRGVLGVLLDTVRADADASRHDPLSFSVNAHEGTHDIVGCMSDRRPDGSRVNEYLLRRRTTA